MLEEIEKLRALRDEELRLEQEAARQAEIDRRIASENAEVDAPPDRAPADVEVLTPPSSSPKPAPKTRKARRRRSESKPAPEADIPEPDDFE